MAVVSRDPALRAMTAVLLLGGVLLAALALLLVPGGPTGALPARAAESGSPSPQPTREPTGEPSPSPIVTLPGGPSPTASASEEPQASPTPTRRRTRTATPRPQRTSEAPRVRETPASPLPEVTSTFGVVEATGGVDPEPSEPVASVAAVTTGEQRSSDPVTRLVQLVVAAGVLLGIGGGVGLYLTRT